jgi:hypothetical protein
MRPYGLNGRDRERLRSSLESTINSHIDSKTNPIDQMGYPQRIARKEEGALEILSSFAESCNRLQEEFEFTHPSYLVLVNGERPVKDYDPNSELDKKTYKLVKEVIEKHSKNLPEGFDPAKRRTDLVGDIYDCLTESQKTSRSRDELSKIEIKLSKENNYVPAKYTSRIKKSPDPEEPKYLSPKALKQIKGHFSRIIKNYSKAARKSGQKFADEMKENIFTEICHQFIEVGEQYLGDELKDEDGKPFSINLYEIIVQEVDDNVMADRKIKRVPQSPKMTRQIESLVTEVYKEHYTGSNLGRETSFISEIVDHLDKFSKELLPGYVDISTGEVFPGQYQVKMEIDNPLPTS